MFNLEIKNQVEEVSTRVEINQVVCKPLETLRYSKFIDDRSVALDYFESVEINSEDHLELNDLSWKAPQNNLNFFNDIKEGKTTNNIINSPYRDLLITNTVAHDTKENIEVPLWWRHKRKNIKEINFHVLKKGSLIEIEEGFILKNGRLYTNYKNEFDFKSSNYRVYFVTGVTEAGENFNELLNVTPAIQAISFEDISLEDGSVLIDSFERFEENGQYTYRLRISSKLCEDENTSKYFFYKAHESNFIKLVKPESYRMDNPWFLRITNGHFVREGKTYWVPEFFTQPFDGQFGTIRLLNKTCTYVTENVIKLPVTNILIDPEQLVHIDLHVRNESDEVVFAITTDPLKVGLKYSDTDVVFQEGIVSWDEEYGFIELSQSLDVSYLIKANFYYRADAYIEKTLNVNFYENEELINLKAFFYLIPDMGAEQESVFYFLYDENDRIVRSSNPSFKSIKDRAYNDKSYIGKSLGTFKNERCLGFVNDHQYLELGELSFKEDYYLDECFKIDIKEEGYLNEDSIESYFNRQHKGLQSKLGYGEFGQVIQKNNLIYIQYPIDLLENYGGQYKERDLIRYSRRKIQPGVDFVVDYTYPKSTLKISTDPGSVNIDISWEGPGTYKLYRALNEFSENFIDEESIPILEIESLNEEMLNYTDSDVENGRTYWYCVRINEYPKSNKYAVSTR